MANKLEFMSMDPCTSHVTHAPNYSSVTSRQRSLVMGGPMAIIIKHSCNPGLHALHQ